MLTKKLNKMCALIVKGFDTVDKKYMTHINTQFTEFVIRCSRN